MFSHRFIFHHFQILSSFLPHFKLCICCCCIKSIIYHKFICSMLTKLWSHSKIFVSFPFFGIYCPIIFTTLREYYRKPQRRVENENLIGSFSFLPQGNKLRDFNYFTFGFIKLAIFIGNFVNNCEMIP